MKKYLYSILSLAVGLFSSCSSTDNSELTDNHTTLTLSVDGAMSSRSIDGVTYYVEAYTNDTYNEPANIFDDNSTNKVSNTTGSLSMILDRSKKYYFLFFAAKGSSCYNTDDLKSVFLQSDMIPSEAWSGTTMLEGKSEEVEVELKRCVAKLSLIETGIIPSNSTLTLIYDQPTKFDVSTGKISDNASDIVPRTIALDLTSGFISSNTPLNNYNIFILTSSGDNSSLSTLTFQMSNNSTNAPSEESFEVNNVPFKSNCNTNIKGHYTKLSAQTFTISCDDVWGTPDNDKDLIESAIKKYTSADYYRWNAYSSYGFVSSNTWGEGSDMYDNSVSLNNIKNGSCKNAPSYSDMIKTINAGVYMDNGEDGINQQTFLVNNEPYHKGLWLMKIEYVYKKGGNFAKNIEIIPEQEMNGFVEDTDDATNLFNVGRPDGSIINQYYFVPAAGSYDYNGILDDVDDSGMFWLSTPSPRLADRAYSLDFYDDYARVYLDYRERFRIPMVGM